MKDVLPSSDLQSVIATICARAQSPREAWAESPDSLPIAAETDEARLLLDRWEKRLGLAGPELFQKRLQHLHLTRTQALAWLTPSTPGPDFALPAWGDVFAEAMSGADEDESVSPAPNSKPDWQSVSSLAAGASNLPIFPEFVKPFLAASLRRVSRRCPKADALLLPEAWQSLSGFLLQSLSALAARTLAHEVKEHSRWGALRGPTPEDRFEDFQARWLGTGAGRLALFQKYPVLARHMAGLAMSIAESVAALLEALAADRDKLVQSFNAGTDLGDVADLQLGVSDPHAGGRTVIVVRFTGGRRLVYKPRSLALTGVFNRLIAWWNERAVAIPLRSTQILDCVDHGWEEFIEARDCSSMTEVADYFRRQGAYAAFFHILCACDFHSENFIAHGPWPIPVDLEGILTSAQPDAHHEMDMPPAFRGAVASCIATAMLPLWETNAGAGIAHVASGIGGSGDRGARGPAFRWAGVGTDRLRLEKIMQVIERTQSLPTLDGQPCPCEPFLEEIMDGFRAMYRALLCHRDALLSPGGLLEAFAGVTNRSFLRATQEYCYLLFWSLAPDHLTSDPAHDLAFEILCVRPVEHGLDFNFIDREKAQLWNRDIPFFQGRPGSRNLIDADGIDLGAVFPTASQEHMVRRLRRASEEDLDWQLEFMRASLTMAYVKRPPFVPAAEYPVTAGVVGHEGRFLQQACAFGEALERLALHSDQGATWLALAPEQGGLRLLTYRLGSGLYAGTSGVALFLANLAKAAGAPSLALLARAALRFAEGLSDRETNEAISPKHGGFEGPPSLIYALAECGRCLGDEELLDRALGRAIAFLEKSKPGGEPDLINGTAGSLLVLLHLFALRPDDRLLLGAVRLAEELRGHPRDAGGGIAFSSSFAAQPQLGMAHGQAGIALAFARLYAATGLSWARRAAFDLVKYEESLFDLQARDWPDSREEPSRFTPSWCAGAPGIGLSRLEMLRIFGEEETLRTSLDRAVAATVRHLGEEPHYLCCGEAGRIYFLAQMGAKAKDDGLLEMARKAGGRMVEHFMEKRSWALQGTHERNTLPGLMGGISGIGLAFLQLIEPGVPSQVLTLQSINAYSDRVCVKTK